MKVCLLTGYARATGKNDGFTILEAMVALLILIVGLLGAGSMLNISLQNDMYNARMRSAQLAAQAKIEEIRSVGASNFSPSGSEQIGAGADPGSRKSGWATREWSISEDNESGMSKITVVVHFGRYAITQVSYSK